MAKQQQSAKQPQRTAAKTTPKNTATNNSGLFLKLDDWFSRNEKRLYYFILGSAVLFSFLLFNMRISEGNDDAMYIESGWKYAQDFFGYFFTANAPLYSMLLGGIIAVVGINLIVLKAVSTVCNLLFIYFLYRTFKNRIPSMVLILVLFITAVNSYFLYYASQTYTESIYLFIQAVFTFFFAKHLDLLNNSKTDRKALIKSWMILGFFMFLLSITRNVAVAIVPAAILFFIVRKEYKNALFFAGVFLFFRGLFEILKRLIWGDLSAFGEQSQLLLQVDPYDKSKGMETLSGFVDRFFGNIDLYLSKRVYQILGFMDETNTDTNTFLGLLIIGLCLWGFIICIKRKYSIVVFVALITIAAMALSFIVLQIKWDQPRIIMIHVPVLLLLIFMGMHSMAMKNKGISALIFLIVSGLIVLSCFLSTSKKAIANVPILRKNLSGDIYYGYTPDWANYLKISTWAAENLPDTAYVACRKAPMSFVYSNGKKFYGVYTVFSQDPDTVLNTFNKAKVTHVIFANLRRNPYKIDGYIINTIHRVFQHVVEKYPEKLVLVKQIGDTEPAYLYEIKY